MFRNLFKPKSTTRELEISHCLKSIFSISIRDHSHYALALRHKSAARNIHNKPETSNERLEFLGDAILDSAVAEYLFRKFPEDEEGELTKMKSRIVSRTNLNTLAAKIGVDRLLETDLQATHSRESLGGNALEALFGAIYLDHGYNKTYQAIIHLLEKESDIRNLAYSESDFKSRLYEEAHRRKVELNFSTKTAGEESGKKVFVSEAFFNREKLGSGDGGSKKTAEQRAAKKALIALNLIQD